MKAKTTWMLVSGALALALIKTNKAKEEAIRQKGEILKAARDAGAKI